MLTRQKCRYIAYPALQDLEVSSKNQSAMVAKNGTNNFYRLADAFKNEHAFWSAGGFLWLLRLDRWLFFLLDRIVKITLTPCRDVKFAHLVAEHAPCDV